jgi:hypothetical protein
MKNTVRAVLIRILSAIFGRAVASCEEAGRLTSASRDRALTGSERTSIRIHNRLCRECAKYARQLNVLGATAREESTPPPLPAEAKRRLVEALLKDDHAGKK